MSKTDLEDLGEGFDDLANGFSKYRDELMQLTGFDIIVEGTTDTYKDLYEIFDGLAEVWDNLSDTVQSRVSEILGGTRQLQVISSILNNWDDAADAYAEAMESANVATQANAIYMETISARISVFEASVQELYNDFLSSDLVKSVVDFGTRLINILDSLIDNFGSLSVAIGAIGIGTVFGKLSSGYNKLVKNNEAITFVNLLSAAFTGTTTAVNGATGAMSAFSAVLKANPVGIAITAFGALAAIISSISTYASNATKRIKEAGEEARNEINEVQDSYNEYVSFSEDSANRLIELNQGVEKSTNKNLTLTNDEYTEYVDLCNQIAELYPTLVTGYDEQGVAILNLGDNADTANEKLSALLQTQKDIANYEIRSNLDTATKGTLAEISEAQKQLNEAEEQIDKYNNSLYAYTDEFKEYLRETLSTDSEEFSLEFPSNGTEDLETLLRTYFEALGLQTTYDYVDQVTGNRILGFSGSLTQDKIDEFFKGYSEYYTATYEDTLNNSVNRDNAEADAQYWGEQVAEGWDQVTSDAITALESSSSFNKLSEAAQNLLRKSVGGIDWEEVVGGNYKKFNITDYIDENIIAPMVGVGDNETIQNALESLDAFDTAEMTVSEYVKAVEEQLSILKQAFKEFGLSEYYEDFVISLGFEVVNEDGEAINSTEAIIAEIENVALLKGENLEDINLEDLTVDQLVKIHTEVTANDFAGTVAEAIEAEIAEVEEYVPTSETVTLYSLMFDSEGEQSDFSKSIDDLQDYVDTVNGIIESARNGEEINMADLMQDYAISGNLDTLEDELMQLSADKFLEFAEDYREAISSITDPKELEKVQKFMVSLISSLNLVPLEGWTAIFNSEDFNSILYDAVYSATGNNKLGTDQLLERFNDESKKQALYEISLAFDLSELSFDEINELVEGQTLYINIHASNESITALDKQLQLLQLEASNVSSNLSLKETQGDIITEEDYQEQIDLAEKMLELYEGSDEYNGLISEYEETWNEAVKKYGEDSAVALEAMEDYYNAIGERNDILADLYGYYEDQADLPINALDHELDALETENDELQYNIDLKEAMGEAITAEDYQAINNNLEEQNQKYAEQIEIWKEMQSEVTEGGSYWWEYQSNIDSATAAIEKNTLATIENKETIANLTPATNTYDLFYNVNGDTSDFSQTVDDFQSDMSSITSTLESLREGEEVDLTDLVQEFGELDLSAENLEDALLDLQATKLRDFVNEWNESTAEMDAEELEYARQLLIDLLSSMDFSDMDFSNISEQLYENFRNNGVENRLNFAQELEKYYGNNAEAMELIYKLSFVLDTDDIEEYERYMEKYGITVMVHPKLDELNEFEATLDAETAEWFNSLDEFDQELVYNISVRADNTSLWTIDKWQQELLDMQNAAKTSEESIQDFYDVINGETDDTFRSTIDDYISQFETLQDVLDQISMGTFSEQDALSLALDIPQLSGYTNDIKGLKQAIQELLTTSQQDLLDAFNKQIDDMGGACTAAGQAMEGLLGDILKLYGSFGDFDIDEEIEKFENYNTARNNSVTGTGLTTSDISNLVAMYSDLEGYDYSKLFENTANGVHLNEVEVEKLQGQYEQLIKTDLSDQMTALQDEYRRSAELTNELVSSNKSLTQSELEAALAEEGLRPVDAIATDIQNVGTLISQYDGLVSAYNKYELATSAGNERDIFENIGAGYDSVEELLNLGWAGDEEVEAYLDLMLSAAERTGDAYADFAKLTQTIEGTNHSLMDYFSYDEDNNLVSDGLYDFLDDVETVFGETYAYFDEDTGLYYFDFMGDKLDEVAERFGTTTEVIQAMERALSDTGMTVNMGTDYLMGLSDAGVEAVRSLRDLQESGVISSDFELDFNVNEMSIEDIEDKIEEINEQSEDILFNMGITYDEDDANLALAYLDELRAELEQQETVLKIQAELENGETYESLLELTDEEITARFGVAGEEELNKFREEIEELAFYDNIETKVNAYLEDDGSLEELQALDGETLVETLGIELSEDTEKAQEEIQTVYDTVQSISQTEVDIPMTVKIDESQFEALTSENVSVGANTEQYAADIETAKTTAESSEPAQVPVGAEVSEYNNTVDNAKNETENGKTYIPVSANMNDFYTRTTRARSNLESNISYINVDAHTNLLTQSINNALSGTKYINVVAKTSQTSDGSTVMALGTAHASGTIYQKWTDHRHAVGAYANGSTQDWALPQNENALVNEVGMESIVNIMRLYTVMCIEKTI